MLQVLRYGILNEAAPTKLKALASLLKGKARKTERVRKRRSNIFEK